MNQQTKSKNHLFSPHTDQCIYCGKSAQDDAIENTPCPSDGALNPIPLKAQANPRETIRPCFAPEQEEAVRNFLDTWNLSMPYHEIGSALNCGECNAPHQMLVAFGATQAAQALIQAHVAGDDEGDDPEHVRIKAELASQGHPLK
jgi:hypothetical protein